MKPNPTYQPGDRIGGRYQVHQALMGSMGEVYLCLDLEQNYPFALKTFQARFLTNKRLQEAFYTEVATWIALEKHPNIVRCFYMDSVENRPFMFLEWIASEESQGTDLRSWLRRGPLNLELAMNLAMDLCRGLLHAGQKQPGIVHRDLKPENILIAQGRVAKITDFGLASVIKGSQLEIPDDGEPSRGRRRTVGRAGIVGTPAYMAPEQWRSEEPDPRTDIYALGCMLYEMASGRLPYMARSLEGFLQQHLAAPIPQIPESEGIPSRLNELVARCLAKKREERYGSVVELLEDLEHTFEGRFGRPPRILQESEGFTAVDYNYRGVTYDKLDRYQEAIRDYTRSLELDPTFVIAYNNRGATYERLRDYDRSLEDYTSALQHDPTLAHAYYNRGNVFSKLKRPQEAIQDYTRALSINSKIMRAYINRGSEYYVLGHYREALTDFTAAIQLEPTYAKAYVNRGVIYDSLGQFDKALRDYSRALELTPDDPAIYYNRGLTYYSVRRYREAIADFSKVIELNPGDGQAYYYRGLCHAHMGQHDAAIEDHKMGIRQDTSDALKRLNTGALLYNQGSLSEALSCFEEASQLGDRRGSEWAARIQKEIKDTRERMGR